MKHREREKGDIEKRKKRNKEKENFIIEFGFTGVVITIKVTSADEVDHTHNLLRGVGLDIL